MKTKITPFLAACCLLWPMFSSGQSKTVTLPEAIDIAVRNNMGLLSAALDVEYQKELKRTSTEIPKTNALLTYGQYNSYNQDNNITITQSIPFPTVFTSQSKLASIRVQGSEFKKASAENDLVLQVKQVYLILQYLHARGKLLNRQDSVLADLVRIAAVQQRTGEGTLLQKTTSEARYNETQNLMRQNAADTKVYLDQLRVLLNFEGDVAPGDSLLVPFQTTLVDDPAQVEHNPLLAFQRSQAEIALHEKKVEANRFLPDFTIGYFNQTLVGFQQQTDGTQTYYDNQNRFNGVMAGIAFPLWFVPNRAKVKSASIRSESLHYQADYFQKQLRSQWERATQEFHKNRSSLDYYTQSALPNARLILHQSQLSYKMGQISQAEHRLNLQQSISIEEGYLQSLLQYNQSIITLEYLSGQSVVKSNQP